jgi:hypothetical protein
VRLDRSRSLALPLIVAAALIGGCQSGAAPANEAASAVPATPTPPSPAEVAQRLVVQRLGGQQQLAFSEVRLFNSSGATIVCGRVTPAGAAAQRYIAVGEEDVFVESQMEAGHMDQAASEFCRNG